MTVTNENGLILSLLGSKAVKSLPRFAAVENEMAKHVFPPVPFLPVKNQTGIAVVENEPVGGLWEGIKPIQKDRQFFPFSFSYNKLGPWYLLPWEPMVSISGKPVIVKRYIAKPQTKSIGTIKERWNMDDLEITITGAMYGKSMLGDAGKTYPRNHMESLRDYVMAPQALYINSEPLNILGIEKIVIEEFNFPFTKGEDVQAYEIKAISDFDHNLLWKMAEGKVETGDLEVVGIIE